MAEREDIKKRIRKTDPWALRMVEELDRLMAKLGGSGVAVIATEDMTQEEKEMALFEGFLKEGYPVEVADRKAKEWLSLAESLKNRDRDP